MGCDIHIYAEVLDQAGNWQKVGRVFDNPYYRPEEKTTEYEDGYIWNAPKTDEPYEGRNYDLFAILADVRNGRGFAGVPTGTGFEPISSPRGLPENVSSEVKTVSDNWGIDGHSYSWLMLSELLDFDWQEKSTIQFGTVSKEEYKKFLEVGKPESYSGGVFGQQVRMVPNEAILDTPDDDGFYYHTIVIWNETYAEAVGERFLVDTLNSLKSLGNPDKVRVVFWFDN